MKSTPKMIRLLRWVFTRDRREDVNYRDELARAQCEWVQLRIAKEKRHLIDAAASAARIEKCHAFIRATLEGKFINELPSKLGGRPSEEILVANKAALRDCFNLFSTALPQ
jgi:hypothetical protein